MCHWWWLIGLSQWRSRESIATRGDDLLWFVSWLKDLLDTPRQPRKRDKCRSQHPAVAADRFWVVPDCLTTTMSGWPFKWRHRFRCRSHASLKWFSSHDPSSVSYNRIVVWRSNTQWAKSDRKQWVELVRQILLKISNDLVIMIPFKV